MTDETTRQADARRAIAVLETWQEQGAAKTLVHNALTEASIARVIRELRRQEAGA
jgi:hypothetical protein